MERTATATASVRQGMKVARTTMPLSLSSFTGSSSSPAISRITVRQIDRSVLEMKGSRSCPKYEIVMLAWHTSMRTYK